jgi:hypothetical protein
VAKNNKLGYGKNAKDSEISEMGNPQPSPKAPSAMDAVQRLNVGGPCLRVGHKIESGPTENVASRRNLQQLYPAEEESLEEYHSYDTGYACSRTPTKHLSLRILVIQSIKYIK